MQESIYNIIPKQLPQKPKEKLYKSKYPPNIPPTGSTFCHKTTAKPGISNLSGQFSLGLKSHTQYGETNTFGHLKGARKPSPQNFRKKHTGTMGNQQLPTPSRNFSYDCRHKKPEVPKHNDKPIHGIRSNKNFIVTNAVNNILSIAKKNPEKVDWLKKEDFGKTPEYLQKLKENIENQYKMIQNLHQQNEQQKICLSESEILQIRQGLKRKWNEINRQYQLLTHNKLFDTLGKKNKKENLQKELSQIEKDMKKLNKNYVFIDE